MKRLRLKRSSAGAAGFGAWDHLVTLQARRTAPCTASSLPSSLLYSNSERIRLESAPCTVPLPQSRLLSDLGTVPGSESASTLRLSRGDDVSMELPFPTSEPTTQRGPVLVWQLHAAAPCVLPVRKSGRSVSPETQGSRFRTYISWMASFVHVIVANERQRSNRCERPASQLVQVVEHPLQRCIRKVAQQRLQRAE